MNNHPSKKFKDIGPRLISAVLMAIVCFIPIYLGGYWFLGLALTIGIRICYEWVRMSDKQAGRPAYAIVMIGLCLSVTCAFFGGWPYSLAIMVTTAVLAIIERSRREQAALAGLGVLYMILPSLAMVFVRGTQGGFDAAGFHQFMFVVLIVIGADVGAYLGGSAIGGPKVAPKLSPKKTWSGCISGLILGAIIGLAFARLGGAAFAPTIVISGFIVVFSVIGDFVESGFKRRFNVKDTGTFLPGHGGVLDRIDSLMFAMMFFALVLSLTPGH